MLIEEWRPVAGYLGMYTISSHGAVRSLDRTVQRGAGEMRIKGTTMSLQRHPYGYLFCFLKRNNRAQKKYVHSMLLESFVCVRPPGHETRHINGDGADNRLENLAWGTPKENAKDKILHGTDNRGSRQGMSVLTENGVAKIKRLLLSGNNCTQISMSFGVSRQTISQIKNNKAWTHVPWPNRMMRKMEGGDDLL